VAIHTSLMLRTVFKLALRQTEGLMTSVLSLMGGAAQGSACAAGGMAAEG
jgi:hypothetical protein